MNFQELLQSDNLYQTVMPEGWKFVWRLLTLKEYRKFSALRSTQAVNDKVFYSMVFDHCYVGNSDLLHGDLPAGITIGIGECIMWLSGDSERQQIFHDIALARNNYQQNGLLEHMKAVCFTAWPSYTYEDVESWTYADLIKRFVIAETILTKRIPDYQSVDLHKLMKENDPNYQAKQAKKNYGAENQELEKAIGNREHPLDMAPDQLASVAKQNKGRIDRKAARQLDRRRGM